MVIRERWMWQRGVLWAVALSLLLTVSANASPVVVGFERFGPASDADQRAAGELLLSELHCARCHSADDAVAVRLSTDAGPVLDGVGTRVRADYFRHWIAAPQETKPGTTMPDALAGLDATQKKTAAEAITHFLGAQRSEVSEKPVAGSAERGRQLYHRIGCVACHAPDADYPPPGTAPGVTPPKPEIASVPLGKLGEKYTVASLQRFLLDPLAVRPSARMPKIVMTEEEAADLAAYLTGDAPAGAPFQPDPRLVAEGRQQFTAAGCAACHTVADVKFTSPAKPLAQLAKSTGGCLEAKPPAGVPHYDLSDVQRTAIRAALEHLAEPQTLTPAQTVQRRMTELNCFACHTRDQRGGPEPGRAAYFATVEEVDLGDEGRLPPGLTGVGAKLQTEAIERTVLGNGAVRPYMATRMPSFGAEHAATFAKLFTDADYHEPKKPIPNVGRNTVGRDLIGTQGVACIACHGLKGHKSLGVPAVDLMYAPHRLRREWFHAYLVDPGSLRPGTRMPSFWPGGKPASGKGNTEQQIDSLWVYLTELDQSRLPEGMEQKGEYELKPADGPIVFRTFMNGVSMQAIAVGFPQKLHAAFDSKESRWATVWRGAFLDAEGTWEERAAPLADPLGKDVARLPAGPAFAPLADAQAAWPTAEETRFGGYRLDRTGVPTFLYRIGKVEIEDRAEPDTDGRSFRREVRFSHGEGPWYFRAAVGKKIEAGPNGTWKIDGKQTLRILPPDTATVRTSGEQQELLVPVRFDAQGAALLDTEFTW